MAWAVPPGEGRMMCENEKPKQRTCLLNAAVPSSGGEQGSFLAALTGRAQMSGAVGHMTPWGPSVNRFL